MMGLLDYPEIFNSIRRSVRLSLVLTAIIVFAGSLVNVRLSTHYYLLVVLGILLIEIVCLNFFYYNLDVEERTRMEASLAESE